MSPTFKLAPPAPSVTTARYLSRYSGAWEKGLKQGQGEFTYNNGDVFTVSNGEKRQTIVKSVVNAIH